MALVQLIYVHGFRGDHTTFQAFPTHLHESLLKRLPAGLNIESCLYPTYKSRRPISEATAKFLEWLATRPSGPVILLSHSMGGLLAAEAASGSHPQSKRIIGLVAFDVPFLGMHPHVIISGIASLLPSGEGAGQKTEKEMNDEQLVRIEPSDDSMSISSIGTEALDSNLDVVSVRSVSPSGTQITEQWEAHKASFSSLSGEQSSLTRSRSPSPSLSSIVSGRTPSSSPFSSNKPPSASSFSFSDKLEKIVSKHSGNPIVRWMRKHQDDPLSAMSTWIIEHFEFGICVFDPNGLSERYRNLEKWNGKWMNYWTQTVPRDAKSSDDLTDRLPGDDDLPANTADLPFYTEPGSSQKRPEEAELTGKEQQKLERAALKERKAAEKALRERRERERKRETSRPTRHFIVLPHTSGSISGSLHTGSKEKWEKVMIAGVEDEVGAHCGLFIPSQNLDYPAFVEKVADRVAGWCEGL